MYTPLLLCFNSVRVGVFGCLERCFSTASLKSIYVLWVVVFPPARVHAYVVHWILPAPAASRRANPGVVYTGTYQLACFRVHAIRQ